MLDVQRCLEVDVGIHVLAIFAIGEIPSLLLRPDVVWFGERDRCARCDIWVFGRHSQSSKSLRQRLGRGTDGQQDFCDDGRTHNGSESLFASLYGKHSSSRMIRQLGVGVLIRKYAGLLSLLGIERCGGSALDAQHSARESSFGWLDSMGRNSSTWCHLRTAHQRDPGRSDRPYKALDAICQ